MGFDRLDEAEDGSLQALLQARRQGHVPRLDGILGLARSAQLPAPAHGAAGRILEQGRDGEALVPLPQKLSLEEGQEGIIAFAVGGKAHDLVLILDGFETEEVRPEGVEQAQRAGGGKGKEKPEVVALAQVEAEGGGFSTAVHDEHKAPLEAGEIVGAGGVG
jgi:hypothetical protein